MWDWSGEAVGERERERERRGEIAIGKLFKKKNEIKEVKGERERERKVVLSSFLFSYCISSGRFLSF